MADGCIAVIPAILFQNPLLERDLSRVFFTKTFAVIYEFIFFNFLIKDRQTSVNLNFHVIKENLKRSKLKLVWTSQFSLDFLRVSLYNKKQIIQRRELKDLLWTTPTVATLIEVTITINWIDFIYNRHNLRPIVRQQAMPICVLFCWPPLKGGQNINFIKERPANKSQVEISDF